MGTLTAAQAARTATAMSRRYLNVDGVAYTVNELLDEGRIAYVRQNKAGKWGVILHDDIEGIENSKHDSLAEALYYTPFYDVAAMVATHLHTHELIPAVKAEGDAYRIERGA